MRFTRPALFTADLFAISVSPAIEIARERFLLKNAPFCLPVSASSGPVHRNGDGNGRETSKENLERKPAGCDALWAAGGSWGYRPWRQTQMFPFRHDNPTGDSQHEAYFRAVLEPNRRKVFC